MKPIVGHLRKQRYGMVQTPEQYFFCYRAMKVCFIDKEETLHSSCTTNQ